jgi:hypothetical protein
VLNLTKSGRAIAEKSPPVAQEKIIDALERIPATERRRFAETFAKVIEQMGEDEGVAPMIFEDDHSSRRRTPKR